MKAITSLTALIALGIFLGTAAAQDPTGVTPTPPKQRVGRILNERPKGNLDPATAITPGSTREERNAPPPEVQDKLRAFRLEADRYVRQQEELRKQLIGAATESERDRIREQLRTVRDKWLERARTVREQTKDRLPVLMEQLPNRREVLREATQEKAAAVKSAAQEQINQHTGKRRGGE